MMSTKVNKLPAMSTMEEKKAELERKKKMLAEKNLQRQANPQGDQFQQRIRDLIGDDKTNDSHAETHPETPTDFGPIEKTNLTCDVVPLKEFLQRNPKPKAKKVDVGVQCDLDAGDDHSNVRADANQPENNRINQNTSASEAPQGNTPKDAEPVQKVTAATLLHKAGKVYSKDEQHKLFENEKFERWIRYASKCVENILFRKVDILNMLNEEDLRSPDKHPAPIRFDDNIGVNEDVKEVEAVSVVQKFPCPAKLSGCMVADLQWNPAIPDLMLVNYCRRSKEEDQFTNYPGRAMIWSANNNHRPEFMLNAKTRITKCQFDPYNPAIVFGGLANGSVVMWDVRASTMPTVKVHPSNESHFTPVYGLQVVGTRNSYNVISMSSEGKICVWEPSNMSFPIVQVPLIAPKTEAQGRATLDQSSSLIPLAMCAPPGHFSKVFVGGIEKAAYHINLNPQPNTQQIAQTFNDQPHTGPICGLSYLTNYSGRSSLTQGMLLTSSFDWSIKLWYPQQSEKCLNTFMAHESIVSDVAWNSMHPAKFLSCGADGKMLVWNLLRSTVLPVAEHKITGVACTKVTWNIDGRHISLGDSEGNITVLQQKRSALNYDEEGEKAFKEKINAIASK